ncbi:MAG: anthranilate phosphoribosyltransferase [Limnochordia bacterium]|jgi:anthranilate phosphoribosyltransferase
MSHAQSTRLTSIQEAIRSLIEGMHLEESEAAAAMADIMAGVATPAQVAAFMTALRMKGETVEEITGCARVIREKAVRIRPDVPVLVDTCGTGGDGANTFNISTTAAFVVAGAGLPVAKHGNRSVSSRCGSADVLEALGVRIDLEPHEVEASICEVGIGFLFAPTFHRAMRYAVGPRRELGVRTVFNLLGPLTNPAHADVQVVGVYDRRLTTPLAQVLARLGVRTALVVHGLDRLDEISVSAPTQVSHVKNGEVVNYTFSPQDVGLRMMPRKSIAGGDALTNARITADVLKGVKGACRDVVLLNAAAAFYAAQLAADLREGVRLAEEVIDSGRAWAKLEHLREFTNALPSLLKEAR